MYLKVYTDSVVFILSPFSFFVAYLSVCAVGKTDRYHATTSPNLGHCII